MKSRQELKERPPLYPTSCLLACLPNNPGPPAQGQHQPLQYLLLLPNSDSHLSLPGHENPEVALVGSKPMSASYPTLDHCPLANLEMKGPRAPTFLMEVEGAARESRGSPRSPWGVEQEPSKVLSAQTNNSKGCCCRSQDSLFPQQDPRELGLATP